MTAIPAGALPGDQVVMVPKRLLRDVLELLNRGIPYAEALTQTQHSATDVHIEIQNILNPGNPKYRKKR